MKLTGKTGKKKHRKGDNILIEILNGIVETVSFNGMNGVRIHHNREADDYPVHWHTAMEIIMPFKNKYEV